MDKKQRKKSQPVFIKKERATLQQRIEILDWHHTNNSSQVETAKHFDSIYPNLQLKQPLISSWLKEELKWRREWENVHKAGSRTAKRVAQTQHPEITEMLETWVSMALEDGLVLTGEVLRQKWTHFAELRGVPKDEYLALSEGWLTQFKERMGLKERKRHGEAASSDKQTVENERQRIQAIIKDSQYSLKDIFNMDETGLHYSYVFSL